MIKPPFTILILKKSHHPKTIRIGTFSFIMVFVIAPVLFVLIGFGLSFVWNGNTDTVSRIVSKQKAPSSESLALKPVPGTAETPVNSNSTQISGLSVSKKNNGSMEITFSLIKVPDDTACYIWAIINPDDVTTGEMVISPRNPTFRGLPLDFRNGVPYYRSTGKQCKISLSDEITGIEVRKIQILAYSQEGKILLNKEFSVNQN